ncbi:hypothetical protein Daus18300_011555 [Diaporthe australafricana]|uniref:Heterokaryon incompatibility domain-containing protein n=1 Tax=Diaporthe australafricana TaxID=127596 RepID=A0ABR3W619_9PEZI
MTNTPFEHSPLDPADPRAFQILEILPACNLKGPICCLLRHCSLGEDIRYEALSYTWGRPEPGHTVLINGSHPLDVTPNCLQALSSLRRRFHRRTLWVDAICIDQRDCGTSKRERDRQVRIMGDIYRTAQKVVVWLGPEEPTSARTITRLKLVSKIQAASKSVSLGSTALFRLERYLSWRAYKIYGLYGLLTTFCGLLLPVPDYSKTAEEVYQEAVWAWISSRRDLNILKIAARPDDIDGLPSWVPAWNQERSRVISDDMRWGETGHFDWNYMKPSSSTSEESLGEVKEPTPIATMLSCGKLQVSGATYAGRVTRAVGIDTPINWKAYFELHESIYDLHIGWCRLVHDTFSDDPDKYQAALIEMFMSLLYPGIDNVDDENVMERSRSFLVWFESMLCIDRQANPGTSTSPESDNSWSRDTNMERYLDTCNKYATENAISLVQGRYVGAFEGEDDNDKFVRAVGSTNMDLKRVRNHSLCLLDNDDMLAVTNHWCQEGDEIFVFPGTDSPFVLRGARDADGYRLVGPALVERLSRIGYQKWRSEGDDLQDVVLI